jgi:hypothetical protein
VAGGFSGSGKIVFIQQRIQVLVDMYKRVIPISMGLSIDRQDGEDFKRCVSGHFQIGAASDAFTETKELNLSTEYFKSFSKNTTCTSLPLTTRRSKPVSLKVLTEH